MGRESSIVKFYETGEPSVLRFESEIVKSPGPKEVLIRHEAIGVNFIDTYFRSGLYPLALPSTLGTEAAGVIEEIGPEVTSFKVGDRVGTVVGPQGSYSQRRLIDANLLIKIPDEVSFEAAASLMLKGLTVQYLFRQIYPLKAGETILFHAAAGGVGSIACQWARHLKVNLIGTVSSEEKAQIAKNHGASHIIFYKKENVSQRVIEITQGEKVPVVYDGVGKDTWEGSLDSLKSRGLMVSFGNASGPVTGVNLGILSQKGSLFLTRPTLNEYVKTPQALKAASDELFDLVVKKAIEVNIHKVYSLKDAADAHREITSRNSTGSIILKP